MVFVEKAFSVLSNSGMFGYIIPNKFIHSNYGGAIKIFLNQYQLGEILDFRDFQVFTGATNYPCILIAEKKKPTQPFEYRVATSIDASVIKSQTIQLDQKDWSSKNWALTGKTESKVLSKLGGHCKNLGSISITITQGLRTGHLESFFNRVNSDSIKHYKLERDLLRPVLHGKNVKRYSLHIDSHNDLILFPYEKDNKTPICIDHFPKTNVYLEQFKEELLNRKDSGKIFRKVGKQWFEYWDPKPICFTKPKIVFPDISKDNNFCIDEQGIGYLNTCYAIFLKPDINLKFVLGILNSGITRFFMKSVSPTVRGGYFRYKTSYVERIPIYSVDLQNKADKARHDHIVSLVEQMLAAKAKHAAATTESEKNRLDIQIEALDRQIDNAVYELYGLNEEERKIVEGSTK